MYIPYFKNQFKKNSTVYWVACIHVAYNTTVSNGVSVFNWGENCE